MAKLRHRASGISAEPITTETQPSVASRRFLRTNQIEWVTNIVKGSGFHWSRVETNDFRAYVANLRAIGCPERTIQHLILAETEELYEDLEEDEPPHSFWETASQRTRRHIALQKRQLALAQEHRALLHELVGINYLPKTFKLWDNEEEVAVLLGFVADDRALSILDGVEELDSRADVIKAEARGILIDEDEAKIEQLISWMRYSVESKMSPAEAEEFKLRLASMVLNRDHGNGLIGSDLSGDEFRTLTRLGMGTQDPMEIMARSMVSDTLWNAPDDSHGDFEAEARQLLGDQRYAAYQRSLDPLFRVAHEVAQQQNLPPAVSETVYEIHRVAEDELRRLSEDRSLLPEERQAAVDDVHSAAEKAIHETLGETGGKLYFKRRPIAGPLSSKRPKA